MWALRMHPSWQVGPFGPALRPPPRASASRHAARPRLYHDGRRTVRSREEGPWGRGAPAGGPKAGPERQPPVMIGGGGEQLTLRAVARLADACNAGGTPDMVRRKYDVLRRHCEA